MNSFNERVKEYISLNEEERRGFDFSGKKRTIDTHNYNVAKTFLKDKQSKEVIEKIRNDKDISQNDKNDHLVALYVLSRNVNRKGRRDEARELLRHAGVSTQETTDGGLSITDPLLRKAKQTYGSIYASHNKIEKEPGDEEQQDVEEKPTKEPEDEEPEDNEPRMPDDDPEEQNKKIRMPDEPEDEKEVSPKENSATIKGIMKDTIEQIDQKIKEYEASDKPDMMKRRNLNRLNTLKDTAGKELAKMARNAEDRPSSSDYIATQAKNRSDYLKTRANIVPLKGAIRRTADIPAQAMKKAKEKGEAIAHRAKTWAEGPTGEKIRSTFRDVKDTIKKPLERGAQNITNKLSSKIADKDYRTIQATLGDEKANEYTKAQPEQKMEILKQAKKSAKEKDVNRKILRDRLSKAQPVVSKKIRGPNYNVAPPRHQTIKPTNRDIAI